MNTNIIEPDDRKQGVPWSFQFWLEESKLLNETQLDELKKIMVGMDLAAVSDWLEREGWLTAYQLRRILDGNPQGLVLGQYRIIDELGEGGFGKVYKAVHSLMNRVAALKVIAPRCVQDSYARQILLRDVVVTTHLDHPNIARAYDANETDGILWFAMELVDGPNLAEYVKKNGRFPVSLACTIVCQVADALQYAHEHGIVHRDIKPHNLLLPRTSSGRMQESCPVVVKVVDFGLAKLRPQRSEEVKSLSQPGDFLGTPGYISPEQARNSKQVDIRSDLYSLGCTFYFLLAARHPFDSYNADGTIDQRMARSPEPLQILRPDIPLSVVGIVQRLMAQNPDDRYQTPAELTKDLAFAVRASVWGRTLKVEAVAPRVVDSDKAALAVNPVAQVIEAPASTIKAPQKHDELLETWSTWLDLVNILVERAPPSLSEEEYTSLYKRLMERLHSLRSISEDGNELYGWMESLVDPWVTLRALSRLEPKTLLDLRRAALELNTQLSPLAKPAHKWWYFVGLIVGTMLVVWLIAR